MIQLPDPLLRYLQELPQRYSAIEKIVLYGSRSMGNAKHGSDVDLALYGSTLTGSTISRIHQELEEETAFPYFFDLVHAENLQNEALRMHIQHEGSQVYPRLEETLDEGSSG